MPRGVPNSTGDTTVLDKPLPPAGEGPSEIPEPKPRVIQPLPASQDSFQVAEYQRTVFVANAQEGTMPDDLLVPTYWANHAQKLKQFDRIEVRAYDATWLAELVVVDAQRLVARVALVGVYELAAQRVVPGSDIPDYTVDYKGRDKQWCVCTANGIVKENFPQREDANSWIRDRLKAN